MQHEVGIGRDATIDFNNYLREVCVADLLAHPVIIGGPNTIVEVDESLFPRRKTQQGRILPQQWLFGGICRETGECFMLSVPDRSAATLMPIIQGSIRPDTTIMSDMWRAYGGIAAMAYQHLTVNHQMNFVGPQTGAHTQNIQRSWKAAKERNKRQCWILTYASGCGENDTRTWTYSTKFYRISQLTGLHNNFTFDNNSITITFTFIVSYVVSYGLVNI